MLLDDVKPVVAQIAECLADWYKRAQTIYLKVSSQICNFNGNEFFYQRFNIFRLKSWRKM